MIHFETEAGGLPYVVKLDTPEEPGDFRIEVALPPQEWARHRYAVAYWAQEVPGYTEEYIRVQDNGLGRGKVGVAWGAQAVVADEAPALELTRVHTNTLYLPNESNYARASGIGNLTLGIICGSADIEGWRVYLRPSPTEPERLSRRELEEWYKRRGFEDVPTGDPRWFKEAYLIREPKEPDTNDPLVQQLLSIM